ncbi:MAG: hypothetical protein ACXV3S_09975 [Kineosporiaceae bacterium]
MAHAAVENACEAAWEAEHATRFATRDAAVGHRHDTEEFDAENRRWLKSLAEYTRDRIGQAAHRAAGRAAGRGAALADPPF